jgi:hypothetical protein
VYIPAQDPAQVTESGQPLDQATGITSVHIQGDAVAIEIGAGQYEFVSTGMNLDQAMANVRHVAGRLDIYCSLGDLLADERAKEILIQYVDQDLLESRWIRRAMDQPVEALARFAPHVLTPERLEALQQELIAL